MNARKKSDSLLKDTWNKKEEEQKGIDDGLKYYGRDNSNLTEW